MTTAREVATNQRMDEAAEVLRRRAETEKILRDGDPYYADPGEVSSWERLMTPELGDALADALEQAAVERRILGEPGPKTIDNDAMVTIADLVLKDRS